MSMKKSVKHLDPKIQYILEGSIWHPIPEVPLRKWGFVFIVSETSIAPYVCECSEYKEYIESINKEREDSLLGWCYAECIMSLAEWAALTELAAYNNYYNGLKTSVSLERED